MQLILARWPGNGIEVLSTVQWTFEQLIYFLLRKALSDQRSIWQLSNRETLHNVVMQLDDVIQERLYAGPGFLRISQGSFAYDTFRITDYFDGS
jgi:hypothetical protein